MYNTDYKKYNVDIFHPAHFEDIQEESADCGPNVQEVRQFLESNRLEYALQSVLLNPPFGHSEQELKNRAVLLVAEVIHAFRQTDIEESVHKLSNENGDILMKYIYKAMQLCSDSATCLSLLLWHSQLVSKFGQGSIVRVLSNRQRL
ncbi:putative actin-related protein 2/3 complex subunit 5 [Caenorhabditis elegans]|uniref:Probable actin-related protein 2/3 complex subunit 5 n=1 Tax=Caenorhabditis elegans TaxID=6239 RepID=ARPC5_CAEEL|nr:putative actin-related protein 2/3 complex subunit 5 [Caenorhabditis elegans]P91167.1 RecName: Full=Probable actin-related protein 2/3 complex subunit 5; AltName: Full=Arp2/3 complex 16 kDa subunit; Short=p16-ARC [Caenorhabditis elegans]CCD66217.1 Probable actin-related protein 2/3 complex subunit 5 [Caenorhabditis elegans]|eukprot:NP_491506.1 Probable actin-related protein 2/3 complex subunit 5 [Caenorhabditis elegans]